MCMLLEGRGFEVHAEYQKAFEGRKSRKYVQGVRDRGSFVHLLWC